MIIVTNGLFVSINCILLDGIIRILLAKNDWLDGFISMERVIADSQGAKFKRSKSKRMAKWVT